MRVAFSSMAWNTGSSSPGELEMTLSTSLVAVCCSSDRCVGALAQFIQQPRVLDGDDGLRGEILHQLDLLVGERAHLLAINTEGADQSSSLSIGTPSVHRALGRFWPGARGAGGAGRKSPDMGDGVGPGDLVQGPIWPAETIRGAAGTGRNPRGVPSSAIGWNKSAVEPKQRGKLRLARRGGISSKASRQGRRLLGELKRPTAPRSSPPAAPALPQVLV